MQKSYAIDYAVALMLAVLFFALQYFNSEGILKSLKFFSAIGVGVGFFVFFTERMFSEQYHNFRKKAGDKTAVKFLRSVPVAHLKRVACWLLVLSYVNEIEIFWPFMVAYHVSCLSTFKDLGPLLRISKLILVPALSLLGFVIGSYSRVCNAGWYCTVIVPGVLAIITFVFIIIVVEIKKDFAAHQIFLVAILAGLATGLISSLFITRLGLVFWLTSVPGAFLIAAYFFMLYAKGSRWDDPWFFLMFVVSGVLLAAGAKIAGEQNILMLELFVTGYYFLCVVICKTTYYARELVLYVLKIFKEFKERTTFGNKVFLKALLAKFSRE